MQLKSQTHLRNGLFYLINSSLFIVELTYKYYISRHGVVVYMRQEDLGEIWTLPRDESIPNLLLFQSFLSIPSISLSWRTLLTLCEPLVNTAWNHMTCLRPTTFLRTWTTPRSRAPSSLWLEWWEKRIKLLHLITSTMVSVTTTIGCPLKQCPI